MVFCHYLRPGADAVKMCDLQAPRRPASLSKKTPGLGVRGEFNSTMALRFERARAGSSRQAASVRASTPASAVPVALPLGL
jgi:hypothetical protein